MIIGDNCKRCGQISELSKGLCPECVAREMVREIFEDGRELEEEE